VNVENPLEETHQHGVSIERPCEEWAGSTTTDVVFGVSPEHLKMADRWGNGNASKSLSPP
jgi:hypothetical protein